MFPAIAGNNFYGDMNRLALAIVALVDSYCDPKHHNGPACNWGSAILLNGVELGSRTTALLEKTKNGEIRAQPLWRGVVLLGRSTIHISFIAVLSLIVKMTDLLTVSSTHFVISCTWCTSTTRWRKGKLSPPPKCAMTISLPLRINRSLCVKQLAHPLRKSSSRS